jgi:integrase
MGTVTVSIYERVKSNGKWTRVHIQPPQGRKRDGKLFLKDDRQGKYQLSWYENRQKQWQDVKGRVSDRELPYLSDAVVQADDKSWFLSNRHRQVADPTSVDSGRKKLGVEILRYLDAKSGCKKTLSAHQHALLEFQEWATARKKGRDIAYVDEIDKRLLRRFFEFLVDGDEEDDGPANCPFTAAHKVMKVSSFYRTVYNLEPGKGPVTKKEYKRELNSSKVPEVYTKQELDALFAVMDEEEHLIFSTFLDGAFRKRELMHLEDANLTCDELVPGRFKTEIRVQSKSRWKFQTKTGASRVVWVSKELMDRLLLRKASCRPSNLLFGSANGKPDYHLWDRVKAIAKRAGRDPTTVWLHKFRATAATNWLRSERLGGRGWDIGYVRQQLGHEDMKSIEHYIALVKNEEMALRENTFPGFGREGGFRLIAGS